MLIFAYGSNMNLNRLTQRVPSAVKISNAFLPGYKLVCNKVSKKDGSAKANIIKTDNLAGLVWGVLFNIKNHEKPLLDKAEGLGMGYNEDTLTFFDETNNSYVAKVYIADSKAIDDKLVPYDWYKEFIVSGAILNNLPAEYISKLQSIACIVDQDEERRTKNYAILSGK
jgi:gamma-glutamylcyclotransferase